jgi:type VI protein secretion system component VasK
MAGHQYVKNEIENESENPGKDDWVFGASIQQTIPKAMLNKEEMSNSLQRLYFSEYNSIWWQFLESIEYTDFGNVSTALQVMNNLSNPTNSPLVIIMKNVALETTFEE